MDQNLLKHQAAEKALEFVEPNTIVGIGSGSTVAIFIQELANKKIPLLGVVCASQISEDLCRKAGLKVINPNAVDSIDFYFDGADEVNQNKIMVKGGGAALTGEKILASIAKKFICIVDETKVVDKLGKFPLAIEVIPRAVNKIKNTLQNTYGAVVQIREDLTEYGNPILKVTNLPEISLELENKITLLPGVVTNGIFAYYTADVVIVASEQGTWVF